MLINLSKGQVAIIDEEDFFKVSQFKWHVSSSGYAMRTDRSIGKRKNILLHRFILDAPDHLMVDHINHDPLDNRKCNLRLVTNSINCCNRAKKSLGYSFDRNRNKWAVKITRNYKQYHFGRFDSEERAKEIAEAAFKMLDEALIQI